MTGRRRRGRLLTAAAASPAGRGYRMPAEWERHRTTWLVWPHNRADWEAKTAAVEWCFVEMVRLLRASEPVSIVFQDRAVERRACQRLEAAGIDLTDIHPYRIATNRSWIRDSGPIFVVRPASRRRDGVAITDWRFNGWARYRAWQRDNLLPRHLARRLRLRRFAATHRVHGTDRPVVLEGGSVDVNGSGLLLTTEECQLSSVQARNPGVGREALEQLFCDYLGVRKVLWLGSGVVGDDTHGHVDDVARFVSPSVVVAATEPDPADENYQRLEDNLKRLRAMTDVRGRPLTIVPVPMPHPLVFGGDRLPASYLNFYISNTRVLVPTFNDPRDRIALETLATVFPDREVVGLHAVDLVLGLGTVHCLTQQEPLGISPVVSRSTARKGASANRGRTRRAASAHSRSPAVARRR